MILFGTFLLNFIHALVLFNWGASRSFVSTSFCRDFCIARETLNRSLRVTKAANCTVSTFEVYMDRVLEIFGVRFPIDLIYMDW